MTPHMLSLSPEGDYRPVRVPEDRSLASSLTCGKTSALHLQQPAIARLFWS